MYSDKENVNILTALLAAHGVHHAVVCPGSRNAPLVHNLNACPGMVCHPVTDERSAGFCALGIAQATGEPVCVCVTSGSALLNLAPAVAEAYYQHRALIVVSADRPPAWIGQLDGQTLPQPEALGRLVGCSVTLPEPRTGEERWFCNRLVNEALLEATAHGGTPVHINVPITEPLYGFSVPSLPQERTISRVAAVTDLPAVARQVVRRMQEASRPMVVIGQTPYGAFPEGLLDRLQEQVTVLMEPLTRGGQGRFWEEVAEAVEGDERFLPDFILYVGDCLVSKSVKAFLRQAARQAEVWAVSEDGRVHDTLMGQRGVVEGSPAAVLASIGPLPRSAAYRALWAGSAEVASVRQRCRSFVPAYSQMAAVRLLEQRVAGEQPEAWRHYGNSTAVRLGCRYAQGYIHVNRGVNGIEGSLSTAVGFSLVRPEPVYCVLGDLSFFYDQNALWNQHLGGNLRILLLNNGGGGIFSKFSGLRDSAARERLVMAMHQTTAEGVCRQHGVAYFQARDMDSLTDGLQALLHTENDRPVLLEVFTEMEADSQVLARYMEMRGPETAGHPDGHQPNKQQR